MKLSSILVIRLDCSGDYGIDLDPADLRAAAALLPSCAGGSVKEGRLKLLARQPRTRRRRRSPICDRARRLLGWVERWPRGEAPNGASEFWRKNMTAETECPVCTLAHPQRWEKCESPRLGASLKPAKLTVLSANTLDIRRNCRHNHMLDEVNICPTIPAKHKPTEN